MKGSFQIERKNFEKTASAFLFSLISLKCLVCDLLIGLIEFWKANSAVYRIWSEKAPGKVHILLESKKFCFDEVEFEIDDLLKTPDGILLNECKSNIRVLIPRN